MIGQVFHADPEPCRLESVTRFLAGVIIRAVRAPSVTTGQGARLTQDSAVINEVDHLPVPLLVGVHFVFR